MSVTTISARTFNQDTSGAKKAASGGPVIITDRGRPAHVLMTYEAYRAMGGQNTGEQKQTIIDLLHCPDAADIDIEFPRLTEKPGDNDFS